MTLPVSRFWFWFLYRVTAFYMKKTLKPSGALEKGQCLPSPSQEGTEKSAACQSKHCSCKPRCWHMTVARHNAGPERPEHSNAAWAHSTVLVRRSAREVQPGKEYRHARDKYEKPTDAHRSHAMGRRRRIGTLLLGRVWLGSSFRLE
jgi:hypothetical protein